MEEVRGLNSHVCLDPNKVLHAFLLRKIIRGVMRKIFRWKSKHEVQGIGKVREEPTS